MFLEKLDHFLAAMARRYDGNPNVAFIDIGSFGMWGPFSPAAEWLQGYALDFLLRARDQQNGFSSGGGFGKSRVKGAHPPYRTASWS